MSREFAGVSDVERMGLPLQVNSVADISNAERLVFPGVGAFEQAMGVLKKKGYIEPLRDYIQVISPL
jgi:imidazole glycerol-phosphate synthase